MESLVIAQVETLRKQLVWGFYETDDGSPEYTQGNEKLHELHELVTAEECNGLVKVIKERITERDRLKAANAELSSALEVLGDQWCHHTCDVLVDGSGDHNDECIVASAAVKKHETTP